MSQNTRFWGLPPKTKKPSKTRAASMCKKLDTSPIGHTKLKKWAFSRLLSGPVQKSCTRPLFYDIKTQAKPLIFLGMQCLKNDQYLVGCLECKFCTFVVKIKDYKKKWKITWVFYRIENPKIRPIFNRVKFSWKFISTIDRPGPKNVKFLVY